MQIKERISWIDWAKFIGLCLVVYGHVPPTNSIDHTIIYSFHMPLFFLISGLFFVPEKWSLKNTTFQLLIPYVLLNIILVAITICIDSLLSNKDCFVNMSNGLIGILLGTSDGEAPYRVIGGASWFLVALFIVRLNAKWLSRYSLVSQFLIVASQSVLFFILDKQFKWLPWSLDSAVYGTLFFLVGYHFRHILFDLIDKLKSKIFILLLGAILVILSPVNGLVNMYEGNMGNLFLGFLFFGLAGSCFILSLSSFVKMRCPGFVKEIVIGAPILICVHLFLLDYVILVYRKVIGVSLTSPIPLDFYEKFVVTLIVMFFSYICIIMSNRYFPILLGQKR